LHIDAFWPQSRCREKDCKGDAACAEHPQTGCFIKADAVGYAWEGITQPWLLRQVLGGGNARFIVLLRDPVERLHASFWNYYHYRSKYGATAEGFTAFATEMTGHVQRCLADHALVQCVTTFEALGPSYENVFYHADQVLKGMYSVYMEGWLAAFPRNTFLVLKQEEYVAPGGLKPALEAVVQHLELAAPDEAAWAAMLAEKRTLNASPEQGARGEMAPATRDMLRAFYAPYNHALARLLGDDTWKFGY
jgi:hypothetical protein